MGRFLRRQVRANPFVQLRFGVGSTASAGALLWLRRTSWDRPTGWTTLVFGLFSLLSATFLVLVHASIPPGVHVPRTVSAELLRNRQATVLTLTVTILGLITAFSATAVPPVTKVAVVSLVTAVLVQWVVSASGAQADGVGPSMKVVAQLGENVVDLAFQLGLIALGTSVIARSGG
jgi:hypothetical protein